ncbi:MAG: hypothetical protein GY773_23530 [Actinomycetia bacterium]|nr:hypothetical protein [Actinomycetes bacterium]
MWLIAGVVAVAGVLMTLARRSAPPDGATPVSIITELGLVTHEQTVSWESVYHVELITRRGVRHTWFGFRIRAEVGRELMVDGSAPTGEQFLANAYRLAGFDHGAVTEALTLRKPSVVCYNR